MGTGAYLDKLAAWHPSLLNGDNIPLNPGLKTIVLARLCYNLRMEMPGFYTGTVRHSELILNTPHNELSHFFKWTHDGSKMPAQTYERTLGNLIRVITSAEEHRVQPNYLADELHKMGLDYHGNSGRHKFTGTLNVDGSPGNVDISFRPDNETKLRYALFYAQKA